MSYIYETHLHTSVSSACGRSKGSEYISGYKDLGYDGIFVTDHFWCGHTCVSRDLPWRQWVERYCESWLEAEEEGCRQGLKVFFGWESTYGTGEDFLIYGPGPGWLSDHPELIYLNQKEQYECIKEAGGAVIQAHPFRERFYMNEIQLHPMYCDAWEVANACNSPQMDANAYDFAVENNLLMTCGSDIHDVGQLEEGNVFAMESEKEINSESDYVKMILSGKGWKMRYPEDRMKCERKAPELPVWPIET